MVLCEQDRPRPPPHITTVAVADLTSGMFMAFAIAARCTRGDRARAADRTSLFASGWRRSTGLLSIEQQDRPEREAFLRDLAETRKRTCASDVQSIAARRAGPQPTAVSKKDGLIAVA
jgi:hypothetical protein